MKIDGRYSRFGGVAALLIGCIAASYYARHWPMKNRVLEPLTKSGQDIRHRNRQGEPEVGFTQNDVAVGNKSFTVVSIDTSHAVLRLFWKQANGSRFGSFDVLAHSLEANGQRLVFATNAGIFNPGFTPCGLHVEDGFECVPLNLQDGDGNFYMKPNGVFLIDAAGARIIESTSYRKTNSDVRLATQSGPLLVINGILNPAFKPDSTSRHIRSGVGVSSANHVHIAISHEPVTFYEFASLFHDKLNCPNAMYLDGVVSRFYSPLRTETSGSEFAGMLGMTAGQ